MLRLVSVQIHTVAGPITARISGLDAEDGSAFFRDVAGTAVGRREGRPDPPLALRGVARVNARDGRLGIGIVGAGRVGPVLGAAWGGAGHAIVGIATVSQAGRDRADALLPGVPVLDVPSVVERSELVLLAVPEAELAALVAGLAATGAWQPGQLVVHTAPGVGVSVLAPATAAGAIPLAIHPAMAFTGTSIDLAGSHETWCAVTAPTPVLPIAQALVVELGAEPVVVAEADRATYAEAIATASGFSRRDRRAGRRDAARDRRRAAGARAGFARAIVRRERARRIRIRGGRYDRPGVGCHGRRGGIVSAPVSSRPVVVETIAALRAALEGRSVALVPTMGALHDGITVR